MPGIVQSMDSSARVRKWVMVRTWACTLLKRSKAVFARRTARRAASLVRMKNFQASSEPAGKGHLIHWSIVTLASASVSEACCLRTSREMKSRLYQESIGTTKTPPATSAGAVSTPSSSQTFRTSSSLETESTISRSSFFTRSPLIMLCSVALRTQRSWFPGTKKTRRNLLLSTVSAKRKLGRESARFPASMRTSSRKAEEERPLHHSGTPSWSKKTSLRAQTRRPSRGRWRSTVKRPQRLVAAVYSQRTIRWRQSFTPLEAAWLCSSSRRARAKYW
mmetsp:Transcript_38574/g.115206  ORF Transcript_38574/g.115206 Transcript_38574/m.115206 type:complete len:277 (-) Transcript_38574:301-1131(-)